MSVSINSTFTVSCTVDTDSPTSSTITSYTACGMHSVTSHCRLVSVLVVMSQFFRMTSVPAGPCMKRRAVVRLVVRLVPAKVRVVAVAQDAIWG